MHTAAHFARAVSCCSLLRACVFRIRQTCGKPIAGLKAVDFPLATTTYQRDSDRRAPEDKCTVVRR